MVQLTIPAQAGVHHPVAAGAHGLARVRPLSEETLADLKLAITEACSNSVRHAYADGEGRVEISYELATTGSRSRSPTTARASTTRTGRERRASELSEGGLGIAIIRSIADELEIGAGPDRPRLAAAFRQASASVSTLGAMAARRRLIVVSNRGPVGYDARRGRRAHRAARRRRPRDGAARARLAPRRHLDRERASRTRTSRRGGGRRSKRRRATDRATACASSRTTPEAYDLYYNVVANPTLWFLQH